MSSSRSRQSILHRSSSQGQIDIFRHAMPVLPPPQRPVVSLTEPKNAKSFHARQAKVVQSSREVIFEILDSPSPSPSPIRPPPIPVFEEWSLTKANKLKSNEEFGGFFQTCSLCQKGLKQIDDLYMYGYLGAFCSPGCREDKMLIDGFHKEFITEFPQFRTP